jgi:hypothetical protein
MLAHWSCARGAFGENPVVEGVLSGLTAARKELAIMESNGIIMQVACSPRGCVRSAAPSSQGMRA